MSRIVPIEPGQATPDARQLLDGVQEQLGMLPNLIRTLAHSPAALRGYLAFGEALEPGFRTYQKQVIANAQALADQLMKGGLDIVTGGTDTHVLLVDLRPKGVKGNATEKALGRAHITVNKNGIPFDTEKPTITSGIRLGSPAGTTRGFGEPEFRQIAGLDLAMLAVTNRQLKSMVLG